MARVIAAAVGVCLLWGSGWLFIRMGLSSFPPFLYAGSRGVLAGLILLAFAYGRGLRPPSRRQLLLMCGIGLIMTGLSNGLIFWAEQYVTSSLTALLWCGMPFYTAAFAHVMLPDDKMNRWRLAGLVIGLSGVWLVLSVQQLDLAQGAVAGKLAVVLASVLWALGLVLTRRFLRAAASTTLTALQLASGSALLLLIGLATEDVARVQITATSVSIYLMMVFGTGCIAYLLYYYLIGHVSPTKVSLTSFVTPGIAMLLGALVLGEDIHWQMLAGLVLVAAGILTANFAGQRRQAPA